MLAEVEKKFTQMLSAEPGIELGTLFQKAEILPTVSTMLAHNYASNVAYY